MSPLNPPESTPEPAPSPSWEQLLGISWPRSACDQSGECCRGAAQVAPWRTLLAQAAQGHSHARAFLNQYIPYPSMRKARQHAPHAVQASLEVLNSRDESSSDVVFYHCRFLTGSNTCQIYEDRPQLCRDFPESPFGAIPACCGYAPIAATCRTRLAQLREELAKLKQQQQIRQSKP